MGNACCRPEETNADGSTRSKSLKRPRWRSDDPLTEEQLTKMQEEFWDTEPHYGGNRVIWDALRAACEADLPTAKVIIESAGIIVATEDMTICYDERGAKYELPKYVISKPVNLIRGSSKGGPSPTQVEMAPNAAPVDADVSPPYSPQNTEAVAPMEVDPMLR